MPVHRNAECPDSPTKPPRVCFDTIVVPRGAEARAVEQGWAIARPTLLAIPAGDAAQALLQHAQVGQSVLVLGLCGALDPTLRVGDTVVYERILNGSETVELDPELRALCAVVSRHPPVAAAAVTHVIGDVATKSTLRAATGAAVIDMEAAALARALGRRGVRVATVRVVSDDAQHELPDLGGVYDAAGSLRPLALAFAFARAPRRSARFVANALRALRALRATAALLARTPHVESANA